MIRQRLLDIATLRQRVPANHVFWAIAIFALAILLRSLWVTYLNMEVGHDGWGYWYAANSIIDRSSGPMNNPRLVTGPSMSRLLCSCRSPPRTPDTPPPTRAGCSRTTCSGRGGGGGERRR